MMRTLAMRNFRSFEEYELRDLTSVNLLVGPNNCGKTSILEAVHLLALGGDPRVLLESTRRRGESGIEINGASRRVRHPLHHHFHGHAFDLGTRMSVSSSDGLGSVHMEIVEADPDVLRDWETSTDTPPFLALQIQGRAYDDAVRIPLDEDGYPVLPWNHPRWRPRKQVHPTKFVATESLRPHEMASAWNGVEVQRREEEVVETMRILEEDLDSIRFLPGDGIGPRGGTPGIVFGVRSEDKRFPIGSYGDGMRRLLALSLSLMSAEGGFLLVDEIDTGLHWSVMERMWRLVVETAIESSIQVFATTHSLDCILGLASVLETQSDLRDSVTVQKIARVIDHGVSFDGDSIIVAKDLDIELR